MDFAPSFPSRQYLWAFGVVTVISVGLAGVVGDRDLAFTAAILGLYVLHLISVRTLLHGQREQWEAVRELESLVGELTRAERADPSTPPPESDAGPSHRHFALGTVAIIRRVLTPGQVSRVLVAQREKTEKRFGELAVEMGLLTDEGLESLLLAQQQGQFSREEIRDARERLEAYHETKREEIRQESVGG